MNFTMWGFLKFLIFLGIMNGISSEFTELKNKIASLQSDITQLDTRITWMDTEIRQQNNPLWRKDK
jgi:hypothetical protein